ncbi:MAG: ABC transporter permease, partial [Candidatus Woesearchaeota archaeon]
MQKNIIRLVWKQFLQRKLRSSLTIIGIVVGISALVSLIILGNALEESITSQLDSFGTDTILIAPLASVGGGGGPQGFGVFSESDANVLRSVLGVRDVNILLNTNVDIRVGRENRRGSLQAVSLSTGEDLGGFIQGTIAEGRFLQEDDRGIVIGWRLAKERFSRELFVGNSLDI